MSRSYYFIGLSPVNIIFRPLLKINASKLHLTGILNLKKIIMYRNIGPKISKALLLLLLLQIYANTNIKIWKVLFEKKCKKRAYK